MAGDVLIICQSLLLGEFLDVLGVGAASRVQKVAQSSPKGELFRLTSIASSRSDEYAIQIHCQERVMIHADRKTDL